MVYYRKISPPERKFDQIAYTVTLVTSEQILAFGRTQPAMKNQPEKTPSGNAADPANPASNPDSLIEERRQYDKSTLGRSALNDNPLEQFTQWLQDARDAGLIDATSMALSTVDSSHRPHSRMVLLKQFDEEGFVWFTDRSSSKGQQLEQNQHACILFFWRELERQVRIEGPVVKLAAETADEYYYSRPAGSRFSAASSNQSTVVTNRKALEDRVAELHELHPDGNVTRPERWGGFQLKPDYFEFWQGRNDRLHDRFRYQSVSDPNNGTWDIARLSP